MALAAALAPPASAQEVPEDPDDAAREKQGPESLLGEGPLARWAVTVGAQETWDSTPRVAGNALATHFMGRVRAGVTHGRGGRRSQMILSANASTLFDQTNFSLYRVAYYGSILAAMQPNSRVKLSLGDTLHTDYSDRSPLLVEEGTVLPLVLTRENSARASFDYRWSQRTSLSTALRHDLVGFDSDDLVDRSTGTVTTRFRRQFGRAQDFGMDYMFQIRGADGLYGQAQRVSGTWSASRRGGRQTASLAGGVEWYERLDRDGTLTMPWGAITLTSRGEHASLSLAYEHEIVPSYETRSDRIADTVSLAYSANVARRVTANLATSYSARRNPDFDGPSDNMARASAGFVVTSQSGMEMSTRYFFELRRRNPTEPRSTRHRVEVDLGFGRSWR